MQQPNDNKSLITYIFFYCYSKNLGFIYERSNKHIVVEELALDKLSSENGRRVVEELAALPSDHLAISPQG